MSLRCRLYLKEETKLEKMRAQLAAMKAKTKQARAELDAKKASNEKLKKELKRVVAKGEPSRAMKKKIRDMKSELVRTKKETKAIDDKLGREDRRRDRTTSSKEKKYKVDGKEGVWRTIQGRRHFFPDDGSSTIPPFGFKTESLRHRSY